MKQSRLNLVFGASGYIGSHLVASLVQEGLAVRAAARRIDALESRQWPDVELCYADALIPSSLDAALHNVDVAYYLIHSMHDGKDFQLLEQQAAKNFAQAAVRCRVSCIVYLGALGAKGESSMHLCARRRTGEILRQSGLPVIELRAGIIVGPGSAAYEVIRDLVNHLPIMITPRWVHTLSPPIALSNLLYYLRQAPSHPELYDQCLDVAGPERLTYAQLMTQYADIVGRRVRLFPLPFLSPSLSAHWLRLITAVPTNLAKALVAGLKTDLAADSRLIEQLIPQPLLSYRQAVQEALEADKQRNLYSRWVEGAIQFRDDNTNYAYYAKQASASETTTVDIDTLWLRICSIGGKNGYYALNGLWTLRAWIDWFVGGPGRNKGHRHLNQPRVGDTIDSWKIIAVHPHQSMSLLMGMKAPGAGVLEFRLHHQSANQTKISITAYWHPAGVWGLLYWYALLPVHLILFRRMCAKITQPETS